MPRGQGRSLFHTLHGLVGASQAQMVFVFLEQAGELPLQILRRLAAAQFTDPLADGNGGDQLGMFLRGFGRPAMDGFQILVPVLILGKERSRLMVVLVSEDFRQSSNCFYPGFIVVCADEDCLEAGILLQHPEHGVFGGAAERDIAVHPPV